MKQRPFAVFDIDGTLIRWQLYHAVADAMVKRGIIDARKYNSVLEARNNWKARINADSFTDYEKSLIALIDTAIIGVDYELFKEVCTDVINRYQNQVYTFTRDLIAELRLNNYLIFAISASPIELVSLVAAYYKLDDFRASIYEVEDGKLTGKSQILNGTAKPQYLTELINKYHASRENSIAVGDSEGDIGMLKMVKRPIAFNPTKKLIKEAQTNGWEIVAERKNVVYQLKYNHGQYILAPTDQG